MTAETISTAFFNHVVNTAVKCGCDPDELLSQAGLNRAHLSDAAQHVPFEKLQLIYRRGAERSGIAHFGLLVGMSARPSSFSWLGYVAMTSATFGDAVNMYLKLNKTVLHSPSDGPELRITGELATLEFTRDNSSRPHFDVSVDAALACYISFSRWLVGGDLPLEAVHMRRVTPADTAPYEQFFGCPMHFRSDMNALVFKATKLELPVEGADRSAHHKLLHEAELHLVNVCASASVARRVRAMMIAQMQRGQVRLEILAQDLAMSPRTLQRKLANEGRSFSSLFESVRMELAERYLKDPSLSITEMALMLGFSQASAFSHAFREVHDISPTDYRRLYCC